MTMHERQQQKLGIVGGLLMQMFGRPKGTLGRLGGIILARKKRDFFEWVIHLLEVHPDSKVLEIGFGPGVAIEILVATASIGSVAGVDYSHEMVEQAKARNAKAVEAGLIELQYGSVEKLPFADGTFVGVASPLENRALAINSLQVWSDAMAGLLEMRRVMTVGGKIALGFNASSGRSSTGLTEMLTEVGFIDAHLVLTEAGFCVLAIK